MTVFLLSLTSFYLYIAWLLVSYLNFQEQRDKIPWRIHVNGIRGKSTVTRYVTAVFRESGYHTFGKTTGSAARILRPDGQDYDFGRKGYPNVNEQVKIVKDFSRQKAEAAILECMAVNPVYAKWLEEKIMRSHIGIITNVRYDHPEYLGETLEEIAESLSNTIPENGILITAETDPKLLRILEKNAKSKNSTMRIARKETVGIADLGGFTHFAIEDNIAIGYEIAKLLKLPKDEALKAMQMAVADPGAFSVQLVPFQKCQIAWANLFAVNDRESFVELSQKLFNQYPEYQRVVILNNRHDRPTRVELFANLADDLDFNPVVTFGDYEQEVNEVFSNKSGRVLNLGNSSKFKSASAVDLLRQIVAKANSEKILLIGTVNIHTPQAETMLHYFEGQTDLETGTSAEMVEAEKVNV
jgi:poly-gamma-glutamate synthase PgsB/CapB